MQEKTVDLYECAEKNELEATTALHISVRESPTFRACIELYFHHFFYTSKKTSAKKSV